MIGNADNLRKKTFFPNLDGLRFFAFFTVFIQHSFEPWLGHQNLFNTFPNRLLRFVLTLAENGVSCFFVLSGFLITYLLIKEKELSGNINVQYFYLRRSLRIWPLYFLIVMADYLLFSVILQHTDRATLTFNPAYAFTFLTNFDIKALLHIKSLGASVLVPTWSVCVEEQFYLIWPLIFFLIPKRFYVIICPVIIAMCYAFRFYIRHDYIALYFNTFSVCGDLALGGLIGYYTFYAKKFINWFTHISKATIIITYLIGFCWLFFNSQTHHTDAFAVFLRLGNSIFFAFVIAEQNLSGNSFYKFGRFEFISKWGKYTYGLYLLHSIVLNGVRMFNQRFFPGFNQIDFLNALVIATESLTLSFLLSYLSYTYFERFFLKLKDKYTIIKTGAAIPAGS